VAVTLRFPHALMPPFPRRRYILTLQAGSCNVLRMTAAQNFHSDLNRINTAIEATGAVIDFGDGNFGIDPSKVSASLLSTYSNLLSYGYANGLI
jgi:hypothetical protein